METPPATSTAKTPAGHENGSVTAEYAVILPAAVLVLIAAITGGAALWQQIRLEEAAGAAARQVARGEETAAASSTVHRLAGDGAELIADREGGWVTVRVVHAPPGLLDWGGWKLEARAHAPDQWTELPGTAP